MTPPPSVVEADVGATGPSPGRAWLTVVLLMLFSIVSMLDRQIVWLLVTPIKAELHLSDTQIGLLQGFAFALFYSLAGLPIGWAVDRYPRRIIIYLGMTFWSLSTVFCGLAQGFTQLFVGRMAVGVGEATMSPVAVSLIGDLFPPHRAGKPMGVYSASYSLGTGLALGVGGVIVGLFAGQAAVHLPVVGDVVPWKAVFIVIGAPGIIIAFLAMALHDPRPGMRRADPAQPGGGPVRDYLRRRKAVTLYAFGVFTLATFVNYAISAWTPTFLARTFYLKVQDIGWLLGVMSATSGAISALGGGLVLDRVYRAGHADACLLVLGIAALIAAPMLCGAYFLSSPIAVVAMLTIGLTIIGVAAPASFATWRLIAPPALRGRITAAFVLVAGLVGGGAPVAVAIITDHVFHDELRVGAALASVLAVVVPLMTLLCQAGRRSLRDAVAEAV